MDSGKYTWNVDQHTLSSMKAAETGDEFLSPTFKIAGLTWRLETYPNGYTDENAGIFDVFVTLITMPDAWDHVMCFWKLQCHQTKGSYVYLMKYEKGTSWGWMKTMAFSEIQSVNKLSFSVEITVNKIVFKKGQIVFYQQPIIAKTQRGQWKIDGDMLLCAQNAHEGKTFCSKIYDGMWCMIMWRQPTNYAVAMHICVMPKGMETLSVLANVECILKGNGISKTITNSKSIDFEKNDDGNVCPGTYVLWDDNAVPLEMLKQCDSVEINLEVVPDPHHAACREATEHWSKLAHPAAHDEQEDETETALNDQRANRFNFLETQIELLVSTMDGISSKMNEMENHFLSMDCRLKEFDGKFRRNSESNRSQSAEVLAQIAKTREEIIALKEAQGNRLGNEEVKSEEDKLRKWMENEVKLPYFQLLKENGFEDMESVMDLTMEEMKEIGIDKMGHRKKIMKHIAKLQAANNPMIPMKASAPQQQMPAASAYSFGAAPGRNVKVAVEGTNVLNTGH